MNITRRTLALIAVLPVLAWGESQVSVVDFEQGWEGWQGSQGTECDSFLESDGGNPGAHARTVCYNFGIQFFTQQNGAFTGDLTDSQNVTIGVDLKVEDISMFNTPVPRSWVLELRSESLADGPYPYVSVWYELAEMDGHPTDWEALEVSFDPSATELPSGWGGTGAEDPETFEPVLPDHLTFADVLANVEMAVLTTYKPGFMYAFTDYDLRIDNIRIEREFDASPPSAGLALEAAMGGNFPVPVLRDSLLYTGTGGTLHTWDYSDPAQPQLLHSTSDQPMRGPIEAMVRHGDFIYATWRRPDNDNGVAVFSLADPVRPELIAEVDDYDPSEFKNPGAIGIVNDHLVFNDAELGFFVSSLDDPAAPDFDLVHSEFIDYGRFFIDGDQLVTTGSSFIGGRFLTVFDFSDPTAPQQLDSITIENNSSFRLDVQGGLAAGFGTHLEIYDYSDPENIQLRSSVALSEPLMAGIISGDYAYGGGVDELQVWNIADPDNPQPAGSLDIDTFGLQLTLPTDLGPVLVTRRDRVMLLDDQNPATPTLKSEVSLPGGFAPVDLVARDDHYFLVQQDYGLSINHPQSLDVTGHFDADLPRQLSARAFYEARAVGDHLYMASWGAGLVVVDISDPDNPIQAETVDLPFASTLDVADDRVYVGTTTNGGILSVLDVTDPANPQVLGAMDTSQTFSLEVQGSDVFTAEGDTFGPGGMYIVDVSNPASPSLRANYGDCSYARGVTVDPDRALAYLACADGDLHLIDISDRDAPVGLGIHASTDTGFSESESVALMDDGRVLFGNRFGVDLVDTSDPANPVLAQRMETPWPVRNIAIAGDRIFAFTGPAGMFVYAFPGDEIFRSRFEAETR